MIIESKKVPLHAVKEYGGIQLQRQSFVSSASGVDVFSASLLGGFSRNVRAPCTHCIRRLVGHTSCLDALEKREVSCLLQVTIRDVLDVQHLAESYRIQYNGSYVIIQGV
jgi:hypothetical protein